MEGIMKDLYNEISLISTVEEFKSKTSEYIIKLYDSGHHTIRKDIVIESQDIVIELKCSRKSMSERSLSEEVASDIVHYNNKYVFL